MLDEEGVSMGLSTTAAAEITGGPRERDVDHYTCLLQRLTVDCWILPGGVFDLEKAVEWSGGASLIGVG